MTELPADDRTLSPYTGWTREHLARHADVLLRAVRPYARAGHALIDLPGPASAAGRRSDGLEGYARTFLLAAFRLAGEDGDDPLGLADWYARGLAAGTDPSHPGHWPLLTEVPQARVEAASVALGLHLTRPWIWDRLDEEVRERTVAWLGGSVGLTYYRTNWIWFQNITEAFLASVGGPSSEDDLQRNLATHEEFWIADGWYGDGGRTALDHYNGWALHLYPLWWCAMAPGHPEAAALRDTWRGRLRRHLEDLVHLVSADGAPLHQGRSLTYRFAAAAPFWTGALFDATPLEPGLTRRAACGIVRHFADHGAPDADGLLTLGWHRALPSIRQGYSGPGSPYWASKGMAGLLLPAAHPVWTEPERPLPVERADTSVTIGPAGWLVRGTRDDGVVRVYNHGTDHTPEGAARCDDAVYSAVGYSGTTAPGTRRAAHTDPLESAVCLLDASGRASHRRSFRALSLTGDTAVSAGRAHWVRMADGQELHEEPVEVEPGPELCLASVARGPWEVRLARVVPGTGAAAGHRVRFGGWPLAGERPPRELVSRPSAAGEVRAAAVRADGAVSVLLSLRALDRAGVTAFTGDNPLGEHSAVPWLATELPLRPGEVAAALVGLGGAGGSVGAEEAPPVSLDVEGARVVVHWPGGGTDAVTLDTGTG
ncbi:DUF2264 domain-containing protein [Streptomyces sp. NPDC049879]|uniref:DUF2264 domain-containing protein n=1 Tax=Streptomyces sp. NPDC049879 TaxID=3365598 RepID=UPI00378D3461